MQKGQVLVSTIRNGFLVSDESEGGRNSLKTTTYCKTSSEIGEAVMALLAKQKLAEDTPEQGDLFVEEAAKVSF